MFSLSLHSFTFIPSFFYLLSFYHLIKAVTEILEISFIALMTNLLCTYSKVTVDLE